MKIRPYSVLALLFSLIGLVFVVTSCSPAKAPAAKSQAAQKGSLVTPPAKAITKGMGALTVKLVNFKNMPMSLTVRAFRSVDSKSSVLQSTFKTNVMQELLPGNYDIELNSTPSRLYKSIRVAEANQTIEDLGCLTGALNVKALNSRQKAASYPVKIFQSGTRTSAGTSTTNKVLEIAPGSYDIEIGVMPLIVKKNIKVEAAKESAVDIGNITGELLVKAADENRKEQRLVVKVKKAGTNETIATANTNKPVELVEGLYDVEVASVPPQGKKGIDVKPGAEVVVEITAPLPPVPAQKAPVSGMPSKKR